MANPPRVIDNYMIGLQRDTDDRAHQAKARLKTLVRQLRINPCSDLGGLLQEDLDILHAVKGDFSRGMDFLVAGRNVSMDQLGAFARIYGLALDAVQADNALLDTYYGMTIAWGALFIAINGTALCAKNLLKNIQLLRQALKAAEKEARETKIKTGIHAAEALVDLFEPEFTLLERGAVFLGDAAMDALQGPRRQPRSNIVRGVALAGTVQVAGWVETAEKGGSAAVKKVSGAVEAAKKFGEEARSRAKGVGIAANAATLWFDAEELGETSDRVNEIRELLEKAKRDYDELLDRIRKDEPGLRMGLMSYERGLKVLAKLSGQTYQARLDRNVACRKMQYDPHTALVWQVGP